MKRYVCSICGYVYDEAAGDPGNGVAPGTRWAELPEGWVCPLCGAAKGEFAAEGAGEASEPAAKPEAANPVADPAAGATPVTAETPQRGDALLTISAVCSNLARGCEKQYLPEQATLFASLADECKAAVPAAQGATHDGLLDQAQVDLEEGFPQARLAAAADGDRGALRALTWAEKVTRIVKTLLTRYQREGDAMLAETNVYVCGICGFIALGAEPPALCPVCKAPSWKFDRVGGR